MKLSDANLHDDFWTSANYALPNFDRALMIERTRRKPKWLHLGAGNIFRAFIAAAQQEMLNTGEDDTGIIVGEGFDYEIIEKAYQPYDNLTVDVELLADGTCNKTVVGSIAESLIMSNGHTDYERLKEIFRSPSLQIVSFTITEKGYNLVDTSNNIYPAVQKDFENGPYQVQTYMGKVAALCYERFLADKLPLALVSMDNCSHNGEKLFMALESYAKAWADRGLCKSDFVVYLQDPALISFPWTAIDKITPRPDAKVLQILTDDGLENMEPVTTSKNTYVAPFVNSERTQYLVVEDWFPNGRPPLNARGVWFGSRDTVDKFERMKVCTCLNPLHTSLAIFGCLLGYTSIADEMKDPDLRELVTKLAYQEAMPVVVDPGIIDPMDFVDEVLNQRFPNPFIPDTPQRIATDTSQKLGIRFGETIKSYMASDTLDVNNLTYIPLIIAAWCRYLLGVDDSGSVMSLSADPLLEEMTAYVAGIKLADGLDHSSAIRPIISNEKIFGTNLYSIGLGSKIEAYFNNMISGTDQVRQTLRRTLASNNEYRK